MLAKKSGYNVKSSSRSTPLHMTISIGIVGGTGYTGAELLRLLHQHPHTQIRCVTSRAQAGQSVAEYFPSLSQIALNFSDVDDPALFECDAVFFATPAGTAMQQAPALLEAGVKVLDLAADFRIKNIQTWQAAYGMPHTSSAWVEKAVYGLPELNRSAIQQADLIAVPGCYPTAVTLGFLPLLAHDLVDVAQPLIADCKSGISGAGRTVGLNKLYAEVGEDFKAYAVNGHRHHPEILQNLQQVQPQAQLIFVPHLVPMVRGIHATLYARLNKAVDLQQMYEDYYAQEGFVQVMTAGSHPNTASVKGTNLCRMAVHYQADTQTAIILSVEDNLVKGAAGQAIQNMNILFNWPESTGLTALPVWP